MFGMEMKLVKDMMDWMNIRFESWGLGKGL